MTPLQGAQVQSLVRELRSYMLHGVAKKEKSVQYRRLSKSHWAKEAAHKRKYTVWFYLCGVLEEAWLMYGGKNHNRANVRMWSLTRRSMTGLLRQQKCSIDCWGGIYMGVNICQNLLNYTVKICTFLLYVNYISIFRKKNSKVFIKNSKIQFSVMLHLCSYHSEEEARCSKYSNILLKTKQR